MRSSVIISCFVISYCLIVQISSRIFRMTLCKIVEVNLAWQQSISSLIQVWAHQDPTGIQNLQFPNTSQMLSPQSCCTNGRGAEVCLKQNQLEASVNSSCLMGPATICPSHYVTVTYHFQRGTGPHPSCPVWRHGAEESNHWCLSLSTWLPCHSTLSPGLGQRQECVWEVQELDKGMKMEE